MDIRIVELTVDLAKTAMEKSTGGFVNDPETLLKFLDKTGAKLQELLDGPKKKA